MTVHVTMPRLGETVEEATITRWLKTSGAEVTEGEPLLEVATDKVDTEVPAPCSGILTSILAADNEVVATGANIAVIDESAVASVPGDSSEPHRPDLQVGGAESSSQEAASSVTDGELDSPDDGLLVASAVRRAAAAYNIDLIGMAGTGVGGRIRLSDVLVAAGRTWEVAETSARARPALKLRGGGALDVGRAAVVHAAELTPGEGTRTKVRARTPRFSVVEVDVTRVVGLNDIGEPAVGRQLLSVALVAATQTIKSHGGLVSNLTGETPSSAGRSELLLAVHDPSSPSPIVIKDAVGLNLTAMVRRVEELRTAERGPAATRSDPAFYVDDLSGAASGMVELPSLGAHQVAVLAIGALSRRPIVLGASVDELAIAVRSVINLSIGYDDTIVERQEVDRFLVGMKSRIERQDFRA